MPSVMKRGAVLALMVVSLIGGGCGTIEERFLAVEERAYKSIGAEYGELVGKATATDERRSELMVAIDGAQAEVDKAAAKVAADETMTAEAKATEVERLAAMRRGLDGWRELLPHLDPEQAQRRADSLLAWRAGLDEAQQHKKGSDEPAGGGP